MAGKSNHSVELMLTVLETCVKNCGPRFHAQIASREFLDDFTKVLTPKYSPPRSIQERILLLIQSWADAFRGKHELKEVEKVYQELRAKGVDFPAADLDRMAPIYTPARSAPAPTTPPARQPSSSFTETAPTAHAHPARGGLTAPQRTKLNKELQAITTNITVLSDMLSTLKAGEEPEEDVQLMEEIEATCREMQTRLLDLIGSGQVQDEALVSDLLKLNDDLNSVFLRYERHCRARKQAGRKSPKKNSPTKPSPSQGDAATSRSGSNLIDFGGDSLPTSGTAVASGGSDNVDEREELASMFSQNVTTSSANANSQNTFSSPYRSNLPPLSTTGYEASGMPHSSAGLSTAVNARAVGIDVSFDFLSQFSFCKII